MNAGFSNMLEKLARLAANGPEAEGISPLDNTDRRGGGYPILLQRMRRGLACILARGHARHLQSRVHYLRKTRAEAYHTWNANLRENRWRPGQGGNQNALSRYIPLGYNGFEQYMNGKGHKARW